MFLFDSLIQNCYFSVRVKHPFLYLWNMKDSTCCDCGEIDQTMMHIVNDCPIRKFVGGIEGLNRLDEGAVEWLLNLDLNL